MWALCMRTDMGVLCRSAGERLQGTLTGHTRVSDSSRALKHQMDPESNCLLAFYYYCAQFKLVLQCIFLLLPSLQIPPVHMPAFLAFLPFTCRICLIILLLSVLFLFLDISLVRHTLNQTFLCSSGLISKFPSSPFAYHFVPSRKQ